MPLVTGGKTDKIKSLKISISSLHLALISVQSDLCLDWSETCKTGLFMTRSLYDKAHFIQFISLLSDDRGSQP